MSQLWHDVALAPLWQSGSEKIHMRTLMSILGELEIGDSGYMVCRSILVDNV